MRQGSSSLQLAFSLLGALGMFACAAGFGLIGLLQIIHPLPDGSASATFLWIGGLAFSGALLLPSAYYSLQRLRGQDKTWRDGFSWLPGLSLLLLFVVLPVILFIGHWVSANPHLSWILLPPLHIMAVAIPVVWLGSTALRELPVGSPQRFWGIFAAGLALSPALILAAEFITMLLAASVAFLLIASRPEIADQLGNLFQRMQLALPNETALMHILEPYIKNPGPILAVVSFVAVVIPLIEETLKPVGIWLLAKHDITPEQGFALGAVSGAGYALFESLFLSIGGESWSLVVSGRIGTAAIHILTTALTGWGLALAWTRGNYLRLAVQFSLAVLLHAVWNGMTILNTAAVLLPGEITGGLLQTIGRLAPGGLAVLFLASFITLGALNRSLAASAQAMIQVGKPPAIEPSKTFTYIPSSSNEVESNGIHLTSN